MVKVNKGLPMMRVERHSQEPEQLHRVSITLSSKNAKNLEKVCAQLVNGAKDKQLAIKEDEAIHERASPISISPSIVDGAFSPRSCHQRKSKKGCTNFRWTPSMSSFLLPFLIQQANYGLKLGRSFKREAFIAAAEAVTDKFKLYCTDGNVENHLRTVKTRYQQIKRLQNLANSTWDDKEKTIVMNEKDYIQHIAANPRDQPFLNKPIEMYDEMVVICGNNPPDDVSIYHIKEDNEADLLTKDNNENGFVTVDDIDGGRETPHDDGDNVDIMMDDEEVEIQEVAAEATPPTPPAPSSRSPPISTSASSERDAHCGHKGKGHYLEDKIGYLASQIGELASAIRFSRRDITSELYSEVMKCEGYEEVSLGKAFDYLNENDSLARGFLVKSSNLRQAWLSEFFSGGC